MNAGVSSYISDWLKNYAESCGVKGYVVGISGGIDSAVTSTLCANTGLNVLVVDMPIRQAMSQSNRGAEHIEWLLDTYPNVKTTTFSLDNVFNAFETDIPMNHASSSEMPLVNTRARLRMTALYYLAQTHGFLVAGTGNKIEDFGIGFYTKYGDGGVDVSPIADLLKSEVYALGAQLGISETILKAAPTDGLWGDDRTDEDQIGASYDELEAAMKVTDASTLSGRPLEVYNIYARLNKLNQHKMHPIPVCTIPENLR